MHVPIKPIVAGVAVVGIASALFALRPWNADERLSELLYGNVDVREVQLAFRTGGRLESMAVDEGDRVAPSDVLATLDPEPAREALAVADANVAQANAQLAALQAGSRPQEIAQAVAQVRDAQVAFENASSDSARQDSLLRSQSTSRMAADAARAARDRAQAQLESATEALALAQAGARLEDIAAAEAAAAAAEAQRAQAMTTVDDTRLLAPSPGIVLTRAREPGSLVQAGQTVYAIALTDRVYVRAYIDEPRLGFVAPGTEVIVRTDSGGRDYAGRIGFVSPQAEFTPKTVQTPELRTDLVYRLRIIIIDADAGLRQGMPVTIVLPAEAFEHDVPSEPTAQADTIADTPQADAG